ncbi:MAG: dihydrodipicolinate synthase family protein [Cyclobacteriaceae bacterium]|nr:dihydrodipicolinate synthase family protein [Cyclobacteriaceae bacterium]
MSKVKWEGVYPAVTTKFTEDDQLDLVAFEKNIKAQINAGVAGIVLGGTLGEASSLSNEEKLVLLDKTIKIANSQVDVIVNIAEQTTKQAIELAKTLEQKGADGLMLLPPMRYAADSRETLEYFEEVAGATKLPIMIYNNPIDYKIPITIEMFEELAKQHNVQAIKESSRDITYLTKLKIRFGDRFKILSGVDNLALESLSMGADGWVAGLVCAFPEETVAIYKLAKAGRQKEALEIYRWFIPVLELDVHPKLVQYIKLAEALTGLGTEQVRAPRLVLEGEERRRIIALVQQAIDTRPQLPDYKSL